MTINAPDQAAEKLALVNARSQVTKDKFMINGDNNKKQHVAPVRARGGPEAMDVHVGGRVRHRRKMLGMSQEKLGEALGLTFQQVQKYERGANRISASRLYCISEVLNVPINYFFEDIYHCFARERGKSGRAEVKAQLDDDLVRREALELARWYSQIKDPKVRRRIFDLIEQLGKLFPDK